VWSWWNGSRKIEHLGSTHDKARFELLKAAYRTLKLRLPVFTKPEFRQALSAACAAHARFGPARSRRTHLTVVFAAPAASHWIEHQTGWSIKKFIRTTRRYRTMQIKISDTKPRPPPIPYATTSPRHSPKLTATTCTNLAQLRSDSY